MPWSDPSWFYSSLSQVTAAIVGFFGGFFILRLLNYMTEWRELRTRLESVQSAWFIQQRSAEAASGTSMDTLDRQAQADADKLWTDLARAIRERFRAELPAEFLIGGVLLAILLIVGTVVPLLALGGPSNWRQFWFLGPWMVVLGGFGLLMYFRARASLQELKDFELAEYAEGKYEDEQMQEEGWTARRQWEEQQARAKKGPPSQEQASE